MTFEITFGLSFFLIFLGLQSRVFEKKRLSTFLNLRRKQRSFMTIIIFSCYLPRISDLKFTNFEYNLLFYFLSNSRRQFLSPYLKSAHLACNYRRTFLIIIHPPNHPSPQKTSLFVLRNILKTFKTVIKAFI